MLSTDAHARTMVLRLSMHFVHSGTEHEMSYASFQQIFVLDLAQPTCDSRQLNQLAKGSARGRTDQQHEFFLHDTSLNLFLLFLVLHVPGCRTVTTTRPRSNHMSTTASPKLFLQNNSATLKSLTRVTRHPEDPFPPLHVSSTQTRLPSGCSPPPVGICCPQHCLLRASRSFPYPGPPGRLQLLRMSDVPLSFHDAAQLPAISTGPCHHSSWPA